MNSGSESLLEVLEEPYRVLGIEPRSGTCRAGASPLALDPNLLTEKYTKSKKLFG